MPQGLRASSTPQPVVRRARIIARAGQGVSKNTIQRVWQEQQLKPPLSKSFKLSRDPKFLEKLTDMVVECTP